MAPRGLAARFSENCNFDKNKTENLFSPYPRSESDINWYTRLMIAMSCYFTKMLD
jgi:hypothetical protein